MPGRNSPEKTVDGIGKGEDDPAPIGLAAKREDKRLIGGGSA